MVSRRTGIAFFVASLLAVLCAGDALAAGSPTEAVVAATKGYAVARLTGAPDLVPLTRGMRLGVGDTIQTGDKGKVELKLPDGSTVVIGANSWVVIKELGMVEVTRANVTTFQLLRGKIRAVVGHLLTKDSRFTIETNNTTAGVRGTDFGMIYDSPLDVTRVLTIEGTVYLTLTGLPNLPPIPVNGGQDITVSGDTPPGNPSTTSSGDAFDFLGQMGISGGGGDNGGNEDGGGGGDGGNGGGGGSTT